MKTRQRVTLTMSILFTGAAVALVTGCANTGSSANANPVVRHWDGSLDHVSHVTAEPRLTSLLQDAGSPGTDWNPDVVATLKWPSGHVAAIALHGSECLVAVDGGAESRGSFTIKAPLRENDADSNEGLPKSVVAAIGASQPGVFSFPKSVEFDLHCGVKGVYLGVSGLGPGVTSTPGLVHVGSTGVGEIGGFLLTSATAKAAS